MSTPPYTCRAGTKSTAPAGTKCYEASVHAAHTMRWRMPRHRPEHSQPFCYHVRARPESPSSRSNPEHWQLSLWSLPRILDHRRLCLSPLPSVWHWRSSARYACTAARFEYVGREPLRMRASHKQPEAQRWNSARTLARTKTILAARWKKADARLRTQREPDRP